MRRADLPGVRLDAAAAVFSRFRKITTPARFVKALTPSKGQYNFQMPALRCQVTPNQRASCGAIPVYGIAESLGRLLAGIPRLGKRVARVCA